MSLHQLALILGHLCKQLICNRIDTVEHILSHILCSENGSLSSDGSLHLYLCLFRMNQNFSLNVICKILSQLLELLVNCVLNLVTDSDILACYDNLHMMTSSRPRRLGTDSLGLLRLLYHILCEIPITI